ncbi:hypothetical protein HK096_009860, partial [Nowakowskiella sp. JEL0078]
MGNKQTSAKILSQSNTKPLNQVQVLQQKASKSANETFIESSPTTSTSFPQKEPSTVPAHDVSNGSNTTTVHDHIQVNEVAAELWHPQYYMLRPEERPEDKRKFHSVGESPYPLPADIQEHDRLEAQHLIIT